MKSLTESLLTAFLIGAPVLLTHDHTEHGNHVLQVLLERYQLPRDFIEVRQVPGPCGIPSGTASWHLCVDAHGDLHEVSVDDAFLKETLRIFL